MLYFIPVAVLVSALGDCSDGPAIEPVREITKFRSADRLRQPFRAADRERTRRVCGLANDV